MKKPYARKALDEIRSILKWFFSINGAIVTLTLLILGSIIAYVVQDSIQRQRYLELLQFELRENYSSANIVINTFNKQGTLYIYDKYKTGVFQAGFQSGYILTIKPDILGPLYVLNNFYIPSINSMIDHQVSVINEYQTKWEECLINSPSSKNACDQEARQRDLVFKTYSKFISDEAKEVADNISKINFNPTQERLHSPLLRLFMGSESLKIQQ